MLPPQPRSTLFPYTTLFRSYRVKLRRRILPTPAITGVKVRTIGTNLARTTVFGPWRSKNALVFSTYFCLKRSEEHTSELQSRRDLVCRLLLEKKKINKKKGE